MAMATNQNDEFAQFFMLGGSTTQQIYLKNFCQNTCNEIAINANLYFSYNLKLP